MFATDAATFLPDTSWGMRGGDTIWTWPLRSVLVRSETFSSGARVQYVPDGGWVECFGLKGSGGSGRNSGRERDCSSDQNKQGSPGKPGRSRRTPHEAIARLRSSARPGMGLAGPRVKLRASIALAEFATDGPFVGVVG